MAAVRVNTDTMIFLVGLVLIVLLVGGPISAWLAFARTRRQRDALILLAQEVKEIRLELAKIDKSLDEFDGAFPDVPAPEGGPSAPVEAPPTPEVEDTSPTPPPPTPPPPPESRGAIAAAATPVTVKAVGFEQALTSRWLVWLGGVVLVLAGVFLVKYSIDMGWLGPAVRCGLGVAGGMALMVAGEWLRRQPLQKAIVAVEASYVAPSLAAAGVATVYMSIFAAYELYELLPPLVAFVLLAAASVLAFGLALLQGPFIAVLGVLGGYLVPILVSTGSQSAITLFPFLFALAAAAQWIVRYRDWWRIAWLNLAGALLWPFIWYAVAWEATDAPVLGIYQLLVAALFTFVRRDAERAADASVRPFGLDVPEQVAWVGAVVTAVLTLILVRVDAYGTVSLVALGALIALYFVAGRRDARFDGFAVVALIATLAVFTLWHLPQVLDAAGRALGDTGWRYDLGRGDVVPPGLLRFAGAGAVFAGLLGVGGFVALWGARKPWLWAAVSVAAPVLLLAVGFWRVQALEVDLRWALAGLIVAGIGLVAAERVARHRDARGLTGALGAYAVGITAAIGLAFAMALEEAWLSVALALQIPALAIIHDRLSLQPIRRVAWIIAAIVIVRLVLNYRVFEYAGGAGPGLGWMIYGYGLPMAAFYWSARRFRASADDGLVRLLEAGAIAFATLLVTLEIRDLVAGDIAARGYAFREASIQSIAWLALAYALFRRQAKDPRIVQEWAWRILASLATGQILLFQVLVRNPLFDAAPVGDWPVINLLLLAYGVPAIFALLFYRATGDSSVLIGETKRKLIQLVSGISALLLLFVQVSLEVRRAFHGSVLGGGYTDAGYIPIAPASNGEWYTYSLAWLTYAGALLALGIWRRSAALRWASMVLVLLTVAKLFLFDMSTLTGLYRVASFLGLGLSLVGIGYLYQRFVFPPKGSE
jgi:uncharacterized membrane protein